MIELVPLCQARLTVAAAHRVGRTPSGDRLIGLAPEGRWEGERLQARVAGLGADWMVIGPDGTGMIDARLLLETDDGALIHVTYLGRTDTGTGLAGPFYTTPLFETADPRYAWLNTVVAVGKGSIQDRSLVYDIYELR